MPPGFPSPGEVMEIRGLFFAAPSWSRVGWMDLTRVIIFLSLWDQILKGRGRREGKQSGDQSEIEGCAG